MTTLNFKLPNRKWRFLLRLDQIGVACIPLVIGFLALLNDITSINSSVKSMVGPLITMQGQTVQTWRALPDSLATILYVFMFMGEFLVGVLALVGIVIMLKNIFKDATHFEKGKRWLYLACGWGIIIWGLGFFEIGGDWFLSWQNANLASFQQGGLNYALEIFIAFVYLKLMNRE